MARILSTILYGIFNIVVDCISTRTKITTSLPETSYTKFQMDMQKRNGDEQQITNTKFDCPVAVVLDPFFATRFPFGMNRTMFALKGVDNIYRKTFGMGMPVTIATITRVPQMAEQSFDEVEYMGKIKSLVLSGAFANEGITSTSHCIIHFFTNQDFNNVIGKANINGVCSNIASNIVFANMHPFNVARVDEVMVTNSAHEIGHSFGALHDDPSDAMCNNPEFIMTASTDGTSLNVFSPCSITAINKGINTHSCFTQGGQSKNFATMMQYSSSNLLPNHPAHWKN
jgi:hypothetical protein